MTLRSRCSAVLIAGFAMVVLSACGGEDSPAQADGSADEPEEPTDAAPAATPTAEAEPTESEAPTEAVEDDDTEQVDQEVVVDAPPTPTYDFSALSPIVQDYVDENGLNGAGLIVVQRDDGVIYEEYWGEFDADRISLIASSSKMISAGVLLRLADDGLLDIDAPVADVVDWGAANPDITPAQLISSRSGLVGLSLNVNYLPYVCQAAYADITLQSCAETVFTTTDDDADVAPPGTEFRYGGAQWQVAGAVAEVASGKSWAELIDEIYVQPCGLEALAYNNHSVQLGDFDIGNPNYRPRYPEAFNSDPSTLVPTENPSVEGGAYATAGDYAKLLLMHLRGGMCGDTQVLSSEALERMYTDNFLGDFGGDVLRSPFGRGMGWYINRENGNINDPGAYGSVGWFNRDLGYGVFLVLETGADLVGSSLPVQVGPIIRAEITGS